MRLDPGKKTQDITGLGKDRNEAANDHHGGDSGNDGARPVRECPARAECARVLLHARDRMAAHRGPCGPWPSALALGPYGLVQVANFVLSGLLLAFFSLGLHLGATDGRGSPFGPALLLLAAAAMVLMGFKTDPIGRVEPRSLHGLIHDAAFVTFVLCFVTALFLLWRRFEADPRWRGHARYTLATGIITVLLLLLPGVAYYLFFVALLAWIEVSAIRLWRSP
jgi:hypothetical protein